MSLRVRLFLLLGGLVILLIAAEWWLVRSLTQNLSTEMGRVAIYVGHSVATVLSVDEERVGEKEIHEIDKDVHIVPHEAVEHDHTTSVEGADSVNKPVYVFKRKIQTGGEASEEVTREHTELQEVQIHLDASDHDSAVHIEMFEAAPGKANELLEQRRMENTYLESTAQVPNMIFRRAAGSDVDIFTIGFHPSFEAFAAPADVTAEEKDLLAKSAGFKGLADLSFYLRSLISGHHDTLAVKVN